MYWTHNVLDIYNVLDTYNVLDIYNVLDAYNVLDRYNVLDAYNVLDRYNVLDAYNAHAKCRFVDCPVNYVCRCVHSILLIVCHYSNEASAHIRS